VNIYKMACPGVSLESLKLTLVLLH